MVRLVLAWPVFSFRRCLAPILRPQANCRRRPRRGWRLGRRAVSPIEERPRKNGW